MPNPRTRLAAVSWLWLRLAWTLVAAPVPIPESPYVIDIWDTDDGLPQNSVTCILPSREGYLWFGTLNGLVRFDGLRFEVFDESRTPGLESSRVVALFEDREQNLWIGTQTTGVAVMRDGEVKSHGIGRGTSDQRLTGITQDGSGAVWLCTSDGQLWCHRTNQFSPFAYALNQKSRYRGIVAEPSGPLWVGTDARLAAVGRIPDPTPFDLPVEQEVTVGKLDLLVAGRQSGCWRFVDGQVQKWRTNRLERSLGPYPWGLAPIATACEDPLGGLLVGTLGSGIYWFDADGQVSHLSTSEGLSHDFILSLAYDREGNLWVGTDGGGLNRVRRKVFDVLDRADGLPAKVVQSVCEDSTGTLWIGSNGGGVTSWKNGVQKQYGFREGLTNLAVWSVFVDREQRVWAGTRGSGLLRLTQDHFQPVAIPGPVAREIFAIYQDHQGALWVGTESGVVRGDGESWKRFSVAEGLSNQVSAVVDDLEGNVWVGTVGGGLLRFRDDRFTAYHKSDGLPSEAISSLYVDGEGTLWIGSYGSGLGRYQQGRWTRYSTRDGLLSNGIGYLLEDDQGYLWIGSNAGLMRVPKQKLNDFARGLATYIPCRMYGKPDGLPTRECSSGSQPGGCRTGEGKLWFPTVKGLVGVHPAQLGLNPHLPTVRIESVLVDGELQDLRAGRVDPVARVEVPAGKERVEVHYTSLTLTAADRVRFMYRLERHETAWVEVGNSRVARYTRLPAGDYRFQVKACNEDGLWSETEGSLALVVLRPLWQKPWFLTATALLLLGAIVGVVHYLSTQKLQRQLERFRQQEAIERERARIARDIHDQVGANLTQVALLGELVESDKDDPVEVEDHARQISQSARDTTRALDEIVWAVNPSNDTLEGLINYACKYAQDFLAVAGLKYRLDMPPELPRAAIPPDFRHNVFLAFKEAVNNVVKHSQATEIWIRLRLEAERFTLEIEDNGRGMGHVDPKAAGMRNGLRNMRGRMEVAAGEFWIGPAAGGQGTVVRLSAPLRRVRAGMTA